MGFSIRFSHSAALAAFTFSGLIFLCISVSDINAASECPPVSINYILQITNSEGSGNYHCAFLSTLDQGRGSRSMSSATCVAGQHKRSPRLSLLCSDGRTLFSLLRSTTCPSARRGTGMGSCSLIQSSWGVGFSFARSTLLLKTATLFSAFFCPPTSLRRST